MRNCTIINNKIINNIVFKYYRDIKFVKVNIFLKFSNFQQFLNIKFLVIQNKTWNFYSWLIILYSNYECLKSGEHEIK